MPGLRSGRSERGGTVRCRVGGETWRRGAAACRKLQAEVCRLYGGTGRKVRESSPLPRHGKADRLALLSIVVAPDPKLARYNGPAGHPVANDDEVFQIPRLTSRNGVDGSSPGVHRRTGMHRIGGPRDPERDVQAV